MRSSSPLVSIVTPTYNHQKFIATCIESVLAQTYQNWEQIIIDDGSTDDTAKVIASYNDPRIRYIHQENLGIEKLAHSYNRALAEAKGELIAILEGDDIWPEKKLAVTVPVFSDPFVVLAYGLVAEIDAAAKGNGNLTRRAKKRRKISQSILNNEPTGNIVTYMMTSTGVDLIGPSSVVIRRTALESIQGFQYVRGLCVTDYPTFLRLALIGKFRYLDTVLGYRRRHIQSATYANVEAIVSGARLYAEELVNESRVILTASDRQCIEESWKRSAHVSAFERGRVRLFRRDWSEARQHFSDSFSLREPLVSLAALTGWVCSWIHRDLELFFRMVGKADLGSFSG